MESTGAPSLRNASRHSFPRRGILLLGLFACSVLIRWPNLDRPLSYDYEWVTAHTLMTLDIWEAGGPASSHFAPIYTYDYPADRHIRSLTSGIADADGRYYYVSYPPFAFLLPYLVFLLPGLAPSVLSLQLFNLVMHAITAFLLYGLITSRREQGTPSEIDWPALAGFSVYVFSGPTLWFHANVYFSDILVQPFFIATLLGVMRYTKRGQGRWLIFAGAFLMTYTEWLGVFLAASLMAFTILYRRREAAWWIATGIAAAGSVLALTLTFFQYASIAGPEVFVEASIARFAVRSGQDQHLLTTAAPYAKLALDYARAYFPQAVLLLLLGMASLIARRAACEPRQGWFAAPLAIASLAVALHHLVFFEFTTIHEFALLKTAVPIGLGVAALMDRLVAGDRLQETRFLTRFGLACTVVLLGLSVYFYFSHITRENLNSYQKVGLAIRTEAASEETVFLLESRTLSGITIQAPEHVVVAPQVLYYAGRDIQVVASIEEAERHLATYDKPRGVVFSFDAGRQVTAVQRIARSNDSTPD